MEIDNNEPETTTVIKPETMAFVRGLVDDFYNHKGFQLNTQIDKWNDISDDLIGSAKSGKLQKKIILSRDGSEEYLTRYYLINERPKLRVTLHNAHLSDEPRFHNHPWAWASLMLKGGYYENTPDGRKWYAPGSFRTSTPQALHYLELDPNAGEVWTLFFMGEKMQDWGFLRENGEIQQWQKYLYEQRGVWYEDQ